MSATKQPKLHLAQTDVTEKVGSRTGKLSHAPRLLAFLSIVAALFVLRSAQSVLTPIAAALLIFYALDPIVAWLSRFRIPRSLSGFVLLSTLLLGSGFAVYGLRSQANEVLKELPEAVQKVRQTIQARSGNGESTFESVKEVASEIEKTAAEATGTATSPASGAQAVRVEEPPFRVTNLLWSGSVNILWFAGQIVTVFFLAFFMLADGDGYRRTVVAAAGSNPARRRRVAEILADIDRQIGRFFLSQVMTSLVIGVATGIALWLLGLGQPLIWGIAAGLLNWVPYFGSIIVTGAATLAAFVQFGSLSMVLTVAVVTLVVTSLDWMLIALFTARLANMNSVAVLIALLVWGWLWGTIGVLLAVPMLVIIKSVSDHIPALQPFGRLLGNEK
jgi:predicted PurR-regulated permease PerM